MWMQLPKEKVLEKWEKDIWPAIALSVAAQPDNQIASDMIKKAIEQERLITFVYELEEKIHAILMTTIIVQAIVENATLLVYAGFVAPDGPKQLWLEGYDGLSRVARKLGCHTISLFTRNKMITQWASKQGALIESFVTIPLMPEKGEMNVSN